MKLKRTVASVVTAAVTLLLVSSVNAGAEVRADHSAASQAGTEPVVGRAKFNPAFTHGQVVVDGTPLHYVRGGSGPAIVLVHGWPQTWWTWRNVMPALATNHTVIAIDLPGLGDSGIPNGGFDKTTTARRINKAVRQLGVQKATLVGHDTGGLIATPYARLFPNEVDRIVVMESPLSGFGLEDFYGLSWHFLFNSAPKPIPETIMDNKDVSTYLGMIFDSSHIPGAVDRQAYYRAYSDPRKRSAGYEYYRAFPVDAAENRAAAQTHQLAMPIVAMGGEFLFGTAIADSYKNVGTDVREVVVPNSGHFTPEENPTFVIDCLNLFTGVTTFSPRTAPELANCAR